MHLHVKIDCNNSQACWFFFSKKMQQCFSKWPPIVAQLTSCPFYNSRRTLRSMPGMAVWIVVVMCWFNQARRTVELWIQCLPHDSLPKGVKSGDLKTLGVEPQKLSRDLGTLHSQSDAKNNNIKQHDIPQHTKIEQKMYCNRKL